MEQRVLSVKDVYEIRASLNEQATRLDQMANRTFDTDLKTSVTMRMRARNAKSLAEMFDPNAGVTILTERM